MESKVHRTRGWSRNAERRVLIVYRAVGSNLYCDWHCGRQCTEACRADPSLRSAEKVFHFHCSVRRLDWLSYHLCALHALLTGRLSLSDVLELAILCTLLTVTVMLWVLLRLAGWTDLEYINLIYLTTSGSNCLQTAQSQLTVIQVPHPENSLRWDSIYYWMSKGCLAVGETSL